MVTRAMYLGGREASTCHFLCERRLPWRGICGQMRACRGVYDHTQLHIVLDPMKSPSG